ncbi:hypothetical protein BC629DRAFT_1561681 [Irpex lacteus]|nr:hypothetical protein BC629DRAFT_1561681 [Irpex lacteus]
MPIPSIMASFSIDSFLGPFFLFICVSLILYGLAIAQVYFYFTTYHDNQPTRILVLLLCILETVHAVVCILSTYTFLISDFADPLRLLNIAWSEGTAVYLEVIISGFVHSFYVHRIWRLCQNTAILAYLGIVLCARVVVALRATAYLCMEETWNALGSSNAYKRITLAALSLNVMVDISITLAFLLSLRRSHSLAHTRSTRTILQKIGHYALSSGILTAIISITTLILFIVYPSQLHYGGALMMLAKVYANSMLAMLNRRQGIRQEAASNNGLSLNLSTLSGSSSERTASTAAKIHVVHETVVASDANNWFAGANQASDSDLRPKIQFA